MPTSPVFLPPLEDNALVVIFGGSGFLGRHIVRRLAKANYRIRVAVRRPNEALFVKTCGRVGQVEIVAANIRDDGSVVAALEGADAVVNTVGIFMKPARRNLTLCKPMARRVCQSRRRAGIDRFVQLSAIGADAASDRIMRARRRRANRPCRRKLPMRIFCGPHCGRPEDDFFNRFAGMACWRRPCSIGGGLTRTSRSRFMMLPTRSLPVWRAQPGIYELGGPQNSVSAR